MSVGALVALALAAATSPAGAVPRPVSLVVAQCPALDEAQLRSLVVLELGSIANVAAGGPVEARLTCAGDVVSIDVRRPADGAAAASHAQVDLGNTAAATRLRVLALALTEQIALDAGVATIPVSPPSPPLESPTTLTSEPPPPPARPARGRVFARAAARRAARPSLWLEGGGVGVELGLSRWIGVAFDVDAEGGDAATSLATVSVRDVRLTAGVAVSAASGRWSWTAVPGFSVAHARLAATPHDTASTGATLDATWAGPSLALRARAALSRHVFLLAEAAGALTTRKVTGLVDGQSTLFSLDGPTLALGVGAGTTF